MLKNITLSAEAELIQKAREKARKEKTSLNQRFRQWLSRYVHAGQQRQAYRDLMEGLTYANPGQTFSRDEMNER